VDIHTDPFDIDVKERKLIRDSCRDAGLPIVSVCCVAVGLIDFNMPVQRFHMERCEAYLDLVYELEGRNLLLVLGEYIWQQEVIPPGQQWQWGVENVRELGEYAADLGLEVAIELEPFHQSLINNAEKMVRFLDDVDHPAVRANVDVSHLALAHDPPEAIQGLKGRIAHVHFSDCDGKVHGDLPPGRGVVDLKPYLAALRDVGFDGVVSIELEYSPEPDKIVEWVTEAYQSTAAMMAELGIRG
jgi:sugar phosphate isomerase/epimerase